MMRLAKLSLIAILLPLGVQLAPIGVPTAGAYCSGTNAKITYSTANAQESNSVATCNNDNGYGGVIFNAGGNSAGMCVRVNINGVWTTSSCTQDFTNWWGYSFSDSNSYSPFYSWFGQGGQDGPQRTNRNF